MSETLDQKLKEAILAEAAKKGVWLKAMGLFIARKATGKSFKQLIGEELSSPGVSDPDDSTNRNWVLILQKIFEKHGLL